MVRRDNRLARFGRASYAGIRKLTPYIGMARRFYDGWNKWKKAAPRSKETTNVVSFQHDYTNNYRRRRAPKRVRRRARKATKLFNYHLGKTLGVQTRLFTDIQNSGTLTPTGLNNSQSVANVLMYGGNTGTGTGADLERICTANGVLTNEGNVLFKSAVMETQIRNPSENVLICEAYKVVCRREGFDEPGIEWTQSMLNSGTAPSAGLKLTPFSLNASPFDASGFGSKWLITNKKTFRIGPGNSIFLQWRDAKNYDFETSRFNWDNGASTTRTRMFKGMTKGYVFVFRSAALDATNSFGGPFSYQIINTKTYHFALNETNEDSNGLDV